MGMLYEYDAIELESITGIPQRRAAMNTTRVNLDLTNTQIDQLREIMDNLPLNRYAPLICAVLKGLPLSAASRSTGADADPRAPLPTSPQGSAGGFRMVALTERGRAGLAEVERLLAPLLGDA